MIDPADLRDVFDRAVSLSPRDRAAFLAQACGDNVPLRQEVERLLAADARAASVFDDSSSGGSGQPASSAVGPTGLMPGARLGPYVIVQALGAGGMGEVYKARDTRLDRSVAIKVLPADLGASSEARQRFEREARAAAALAHSHICRLLDVGRHGDTDYLVMELLEGETLAARLRRGKLPLRQALTYGMQVAGALVVAQRAGIVHRDLKPGNIMLTPEGAVLLDFGLARQTAPIALDGPTASVEGPITRTGVILGTVQYMAPEQLEGAAVDGRTDIFALGVVLYEMVTGRRAFEGSNHASVIGNILHRDPPTLASVEAMTPPALDRLVQKCLAKAPSDRWQSASEVVARLEALQETLADSSAHSEPMRRRPRRWPLAAGLALLLVAGSGAAWWYRPHATGALGVDKPRELPPSQRALTRLTFDPGLQTDPTFSPDGRLIAYASDKAGNFDIWVQPVAGGNAVQVTKSSSDETQPDWSPDGTTLVFRSSRDQGGLWVVPVLGGSERKLTNLGYRPRFSPDGTRVLFVDALTYESQRISPHAFVVSAAGGTPAPVGGSIWPTLGWIQAIDWHPDGRISVLSFAGGAARADTTSELAAGRFVTMDVDGKRAMNSEIRPDVRSQLRNCVGLTEFRWYGGGDRLLLVCESATTRNIWAVSLDAATLAWTGPVRQMTVGAEFDSRLSASSSAHVVAFTNEQSVTRLWAFDVDEQRGTLRGHGAPVTAADFAPGAFELSPNGQALTYTGAALGSRQRQLWDLSLASGHRELREAGDAVPVALRQSVRGSTCYLRRDPDGHFRVVFRRSGDSVVSVAAQSVGLILPFSWTPADDGIVGSAVLGERSHFSIVRWSAAATTERPPAERILSDPRFDLWNGAISPNGKWLCLNANTGETGGVSVIGVAAAAGDPYRSWVHVTSDTDWSDHPRWAAGGSMLFYTAGYRDLVPNVWAVAFDPESGKPNGRAHRVTTFDSPSRSLSRDINMEVAVANGRLIAAVTETTGNIWMLDNVDR